MDSQTTEPQIVAPKKLRIVWPIIGFIIALAAALMFWDMKDSSIPSTPSVDMTNWQTYRNEEYGFEFKYPSDWTVNDLSNYSEQEGEFKQVEICAPNGEKCIDLLNTLIDQNLVLALEEYLPSHLMSTANLIASSIKNF